MGGSAGTVLAVNHLILSSPSSFSSLSNRRACLAAATAALASTSSSPTGPATISLEDALLLVGLPAPTPR